MTGATRQQALERSRRALADFVVDGIPTALTFHSTVVNEPDFAPADPNESFVVHTRWIETEFDNQIPAYSGTLAESPEPTDRETLTVEVGGKRVEISVPAGLGSTTASSSGSKKPAKRGGGGKSSAAASGDSLTSPMQGTIVKLAVEEGATVAVGDLVVVLEAMKMEQPLNAHKAGTITGLSAEVGATVSAGAVLCEIKD